MNKIIICILLIFTSVFFSSCTKDKVAILFNNNPITTENVMKYSSVFQTNQRIYYLILIPKNIKTRKIEIQVIKKDNDYMRLGYNLYWSYTAYLKEEQMYYYDDYVVIQQPGAYVMRVYSKDNPTKTLCMSQFFVKN